MKRVTGVVFLGGVLLMSAYFVTSVDSSALIETAKTSLKRWEVGRQQQPWIFAAAYCGAYFFCCALCIPGMFLLTMLGGAMFGWVPGLIFVTFSSAAGSTSAFCAGRGFFRDWIGTHLITRFPGVDERMVREGFVYLVTLRMIPMIPYYVINLIASVTSVPLRAFFLATAFGMIPVHAVYINAGTHLANTERVEDVMSPEIILSLVAIAALPLTMRIAARWRAASAMRS